MSISRLCLSQSTKTNSLSYYFAFEEPHTLKHSYRGHQNQKQHPLEVIKAQKQHSYRGHQSLEITLL